MDPSPRQTEPEEKTEGRDSFSTASVAPDEKLARKSGSRLRGMDVARAVAVLGMVAVHFGPNPLPETLGGELYGVFYGRASVLFVLLAGVGVSLLARRGAGWSLRGRLLTRGALLLPLGMWLQGLDHNVLVILQYYAVYFLLAALVVSLPGRYLLAGVAASLTLGPVLYLWGFGATPRLYVEGYAAFGEPVGEVIYDLLLSGAYPVATWAAPLLAGIWLGRRDLRATSTRLWMFFGGAPIAVGAVILSRNLAPDDIRLLFESPRYPLDAGFGALLFAGPHSQMPLWMIGATASAAATLGACLLLADLLPRLLWPLAATGQLALTVYVGHILLLSSAPALVEREMVPQAALSVVTFMVVVASLCVAWRHVFEKGPLEAALAAPWRAVERASGSGKDKPVQRT